MNQLQLMFLGPFTIVQNRLPIAALDSNKARALLVYLAVERTNHTRDFLATLFWSESSASSARTNLRQALYQLRRALNDEVATPPLILATRQTVGLNPDAAVTVDVLQFRALLAAVFQHTHDQILTCEPCRQRLDQAQALYHADFLSGFAVDDSAQFEEWRRITQEQLHLQAIDTLQQLALIAMHHEDLAALLRYADRQLALEPLREEAHRQRMWALAQSGQRGAALEQYHLCRQRLVSELGIEPDLKTVALYDRIRQHQFMPMSAVPAPSLPVAPIQTSGTHLPMQLTPFIGREREVAEVVSLIRQPQPQLLTLVGPGGMGKTRLAIESARRALDVTPEDAAGPPTPLLYPDGVFFVSLAPVQSAGALAPAIIAALALPVVGGDPETLLLTYLRTQRLLLILDNFEHLLDGVPFVVAIIQQAPGVKLVITARERLNIQNEQLYFVHEMDYTVAGTLADAANASAVRLFVDRAQRVQPTFQLRQENLATVRHICRLVRGMPLGLELAAAWVELLSLTEIIAEIEKNVDFLAVDWRTVPDRQRSMRAVFTWSWQLLTAEEQQVFCHLALFRGGFTREAALSVAGASLRIVAALVRKSLVRRVEGATATPRYEIHELLRQFAAEALALRPTVQGRVEELYSNYYLNLVVVNQERLRTHEPQRAVAELQAEMDNIRQAWQLAAQHHWLSPLAQSLVALREFYVFTGLTREGAALFQEAIDALSQPPQPSGRPIDLLAQSRLLSLLHGYHGSFLIALGEHTAAQAAAEAARQLGQLHDAPAGLLLGTLVLGQAHRRLGNSRMAEQLLLQTIALAHQQRGQPLYREILADVERRADGWLCSIALTQDDYLAAQQYAQAGLAICRSIGHLAGEIACLTDVFDVARILGDYATARQECERALQLARQIDFRWGEAGALWGLGETLRLSGEYALAAEALAEAGHRFHAIAQYPTEGEVWTDQARLQLYLGDYAAAAQSFATADTILQGLHYPAWETYHWLLPRALLAQVTGHSAEALRYATRGLQMAQELYGRAQQADALVVLGLVMEAGDNTVAPLAHYQQALAHYSALGLHHKAAEPQAGLARLALQRGDHSAALAHVMTLLQRIDELPHVGCDEPFRIYLSSYQVLVACGDARAAAVLNQGYTLLRQFADRLPDAQAQRRFLEEVPVHRALGAAYAAHKR